MAASTAVLAAANSAAYVEVSTDDCRLLMHLIGVDPAHMSAPVTDLLPFCAAPQSLSTNIVVGISTPRGVGSLDDFCSTAYS